MNAKLCFYAIAAVLLLAGCGNKGPLVMPQKPVPVEEPAPAEPATQPADEPADEPAAPAPPTGTPAAVPDDGNG